VRNFHFERDQLFDLTRDPNEENDLIKSEPEVAAKMAARLERWFEEIDAKLPVKNTGGKVIDQISEKFRDKDAR
jgi:hypothetical protein